MSGQGNSEKTPDTRVPKICFNELEEIYLEDWKGMESDGVRFKHEDDQDVSLAWKQWREKKNENIKLQFYVMGTREQAYKYCLHYAAGNNSNFLVREFLKVNKGEVNFDKDNLELHRKNAKQNVKEYYTKYQGDYSFEDWDNELSTHQKVSSGNKSLFGSELENKTEEDRQSLIDLFKEKDKECQAMLIITLITNAGLAEDNLFVTTRKTSKFRSVSDSILAALQLAPPFNTSMRAKYASIFLHTWDNKEWKEWRTKKGGKKKIQLCHMLLRQLRRLHFGEEPPTDDDFASHTEYEDEIYCSQEEYKALDAELRKWSTVKYGSACKSELFEGVMPDRQYHRDGLFGFYTFSGFKQKALKTIPSLNQLNNIIALRGLSDHRPGLTMLLDGIDLCTVPFLAKLAEVADNVRLKQLMNVLRNGGDSDSADVNELEKIVDRNDPYRSLTALWEARTTPCPWLKILIEAADDTWITQIRSIAWFKPFEIGIRFEDKGTEKETKINIEVNWKIGEDLKKEFDLGGRGPKNRLILNIHLHSRGDPVPQTELPPAGVLRSMVEHFREQVWKLGPNFLKDMKKPQGPKLMLSNFNPWTPLVGERVSRSLREVAADGDESLFKAVEGTSFGDLDKCKVIVFVTPKGSSDWYKPTYNYCVLATINTQFNEDETLPNIIVARMNKAAGTGCRYKLLCEENSTIWKRVRELGKQQTNEVSASLVEEVTECLNKNFQRKYLVRERYKEYKIKHKKFGDQLCSPFQRVR
eukprot:TRINITY_DN1176_c1_g3_i1.p1 TRINITY_DN1176_c1_g3~~TRINITY_DN1176_c1_g3_i1.p1  ORF type:complete len:754 (+),score=61.07 TRINITY_DN1176_c1_g3_i1:54-2315(+)